MAIRRATRSCPEGKSSRFESSRVYLLLPEAHASLGMVKTLYEWDWAGGESEIKEALRLNPSYETAYRWMPLSSMEPSAMKK